MKQSTLIDPEKVEELANPTAKIMELLTKRYSQEFFIPEFRDKPSGYNHRIDALVIWLHPSRSRNIECFEIKTQRSDWIKELNRPDKADEVAKHCDKIWLITSNEDIAKMEEIPDNWGWMILHGSRLKVLKQAPKLEPVFDRDFLITVAQYSNQKIDILLGERYWKGFEEGKASGSSTPSDDHHWERQELEDMRKELKALEDATGLDIKWMQEDHIKEIVSIAKAVKNLKDNYAFETTEDSLERLQTCLNDVKEKIRILKEKADITKKT